MEGKLLILGVIFVSSLLAACWFFALRHRIARILHWPQVRAQVAAGSVVFHSCQGSVNSFIHSDGYVPTARFVYFLNGMTYEGDTLLPVGWTVRAREIDSMRREIEVFSQVFHNPQNPAEAYLEIPNRFRHGSISRETVGLFVALVCVTVSGVGISRSI